MSFSAKRAAASNAGKSVACSWKSMLRPSPKPPNRLPCAANDWVSGKPTRISSLMSLPSSSMLSGIERTHADAGAERAREHVVVLERGLLLARHVGREALGERLHELALDGVDVGARRRLDEAVDGVALDRRQVVERRQQDPGEHHGRQEQHGHGDVAALRRIRPAHDPARRWRRIGRWNPCARSRC